MVLCYMFVRNFMLPIRTASLLSIYLFFKKDFFLRFDVLRLRSIFQLLFNSLRILVKKLLDESEIWPTKFCCSLLTAFARFICVSC